MIKETHIIYKERWTHQRGNLINKWERVFYQSSMKTSPECLRPFYTQQCEWLLPVLWSAEQSGAYLQRVADHHDNLHQSGCFWLVVCGRSLNSVPSLTHEHWTKRVCIYLYFLFTIICHCW